MKTLDYLLDRFKLGLRGQICPICVQSPLHQPHLLICPLCESALHVRPTTSVRQLEGGAVYSATDFSAGIKRLLYGLKFYGKTQQDLALSELLIHYWFKIPGLYPKPWLVIPIPAHSDTKVGHVSRFARPFASHFGYDYLEDALIWTRPVLKQHGLSSKRSRHQNMSGALTVNPKMLSRLHACDWVLIVDDLTTSGATLQEAFQACLRIKPGLETAALTVSMVPFFNPNISQ